MAAAEETLSREDVYDLIYQKWSVVLEKPEASLNDEEEKAVRRRVECRMLASNMYRYFGQSAAGLFADSLKSKKAAELNLIKLNILGIDAPTLNVDTGEFSDTDIPETAAIRYDAAADDILIDVPSVTAPELANFIASLWMNTFAFVELSEEERYMKPVRSANQEIGQDELLGAIDTTHFYLASHPRGQVFSSEISPMDRAVDEGGL